MIKPNRGDFQPESAILVKTKYNYHNAYSAEMAKDIYLGKSFPKSFAMTEFQSQDSKQFNFFILFSAFYMPGFNDNINI